MIPLLSRLVLLALLPLSASAFLKEAAMRLPDELAAVEVLNNGAVWLSPKTDAAHRGPILAALSALLLFEELRPTLPE